MLSAITKLDHSLTAQVHGITKRNDLIHTTAVIFARWVFWILLIGLLVAVFLRRDPILVSEFFYSLSASLVVGVVMNLILGKIFVRKRPFETLKLHALISTTWLGGSFPSDHAMLSFSLATPLWIYDPVTGIWAMLVALFIAISRVAVGVHYFTDVLVGSLVGILSAHLVFMVI